MESAMITSKIDPETIEPGNGVSARMGANNQSPGCAKNPRDPKANNE
jgi:hypothetical protein